MSSRAYSTIWTQEHMCITHRCRQQCGDGWRGGGEGEETVGENGDTCNSINKKLILKIKWNIFRKKAICHSMHIINIWNYLWLIEYNIKTILGLHWFLFIWKNSSVLKSEMKIMLKKPMHSHMCINVIKYLKEEGKNHY